MKRLNWILPIFFLALVVCPALLWAEAVTILPCGAGGTVRGVGAPSSCSETLTGVSGSATIKGYVDGGTLWFGSSLSIEANNYSPNVLGGWWNPLAQAGWEETITFFYGFEFERRTGSLELIYEVSGTVNQSGFVYDGRTNDFPIRGIMYIKGVSTGPNPWNNTDVYKDMYTGVHNEVQVKNVIPFTFWKPQVYGAWLRSEVLLMGDSIPAMNGVASANFANTATLAGVRVLDANGNDITSQISMTTTSGETDPFGLKDGNPVPEPASLILLGTGLAGIGLAAWRRKKA